MRATYQALRGRTVVVTRPRMQSARLTRELTRAGARVIAAPLIKIAPPPSFTGLDRALRGLSGFDCAVFASRNAAVSFFARAKALGLGTPAAPARVFAVGPETSDALRSFGWRPRALADRFDSAALAGAMGPVRGLKILIPRAARAREELPRLLRRRGAIVTCAQAYRTTGDPAGAKVLRGAAARAIDAVTFTSPSTVEAFLSALGRARARAILARAAAVSIGPVTSAALRRRGLRPIQAPRATSAGLVEAISEHLRR